MSRAERIKAVRRGLEKRRVRLAKSMAHIPNPRPRDLEHWELLRADVAQFEATLAVLLAGGDPPAPPVTGARTRELPDNVEAGHAVA